MRITYLLGSFIPKGHKEGENISFKYHIPIKVTELQKEMLIASPDKRKHFVNMAEAALLRWTPSWSKAMQPVMIF